MIYTVKAVNGHKEWESKYGVMIAYKLDLDDDAGKLVGDVELNQVKKTPAPVVGQELDGTIGEGKFGPKFTKTPPQTGGGGGGGSRPRDPSERQSIERQVAFKGAVELVSRIELEKRDSISIKSALTDFFNHGLALIQGEAPKPIYKAPPDVPAGHGSGKSPHDHAMDELRTRYAKWAGDDPDAPAAWQNKLASMGLETPTDASDTQLEELIAFLKAPS